METKIDWLEEINDRICLLKERQNKVLESLKNRPTLSYDEVISKGQEI